MVIADLIRARVTMPDVIAQYTDAKPIRGRIPCPIHSGSDRNFSFDDEKYHCFVCDASGDVIRFVEQLFGIGFGQAVSRINYDFRLGLPVGKQRITAEQANRFRAEASTIAKARESRERVATIREERYFAACDAYANAQRVINELRPKARVEYVDPRLTDALTLQTAAAKIMGDCIEEEYYERHGDKHHTGIQP